MVWAYRLWIALGFSPKVTDIYGAYLVGVIGHRGVCKWLRPEQVPDFIRIHRQLKMALDEDPDGTSMREVPATVLQYVVITIDRHPDRLPYAMRQLDSLIESGLQQAA